MGNGPIPQGETTRPSAFISERHRNPAEMMVQAPPANYTLAGVCAILATLLFAAMLAVMYLEWKDIASA